MEAGTRREVRIEGGVIRYREVGTGPALLFDLPDARLEAVAGSRAFVPEDAPGRLATLVEKFFEEGARGPHGGRGVGVFYGD